MKSDLINADNSDGKTRKKTVSARQLAANRANAQKSSGPKTQAGKNRSKYNSLKHGITSQEVCIPSESLELYEQRRQAYIDLCQPQNIAEEDALDDYVAARWRKKRVIKYETALIMETRLRLHHENQLTYDTLSLDVEVALAFKYLSDNSNAIALLDRYETRVMRDIRSSWDQFQKLTASRPVVPDAPAQPPCENGEVALPNEPIEAQPAMEATASEPSQPSAEPQSQPEQAKKKLPTMAVVFRASEPPTDNSQLSTDNSQLITPNSQPAHSSKRALGHRTAGSA